MCIIEYITYWRTILISPVVFMNMLIVHNPAAGAWMASVAYNINPKY